MYSAHFVYQETFQLTFKYNVWHPDSSSARIVSARVTVLWMIIHHLVVEATVCWTLALQQRAVTTARLQASLACSLLAVSSVWGHRYRALSCTRPYAGLLVFSLLGVITTSGYRGNVNSNSSSSAGGRMGRKAGGWYRVCSGCNRWWRRAQVITVFR